MYFVVNSSIKVIKFIYEPKFILIPFKFNLIYVWFFFFMYTFSIYFLFNHHVPLLSIIGSTPLLSYVSTLIFIISIYVENIFFWLYGFSLFCLIILLISILLFNLFFSASLLWFFIILISFFSLLYFHFLLTIVVHSLLLISECINTLDIIASMLLNLLLDSVTILNAYSFYSVLFLIDFFISIVVENAKEKPVLAIPTGTSITLAEKAIDTPPIVADKTIKAFIR